MRVLCAWCPVVIQDGPPSPVPVSHGICTACYQRVLQVELKTLREQRETEAA